MCNLCVCKCARILCVYFLTWSLFQEQNPLIYHTGFYNRIRDNESTIFFQSLIIYWMKLKEYYYQMLINARTIQGHVWARSTMGQVQDDAGPCCRCNCHIYDVTYASIREERVISYRVAQTSNQGQWMEWMNSTSASPPRIYEISTCWSLALLRALLMAASRLKISLMALVLSRLPWKYIFHFSIQTKIQYRLNNKSKLLRKTDQSELYLWMYKMLFK